MHSTLGLRSSRRALPLSSKKVLVASLAVVALDSATAFDQPPIKAASFVLEFSSKHPKKELGAERL